MKSAIARRSHPSSSTENIPQKQYVSLQVEQYFTVTIGRTDARNLEKFAANLSPFIKANFIDPSYYFYHDVSVILLCPI